MMRRWYGIYDQPNFDSAKYYDGVNIVFEIMKFIIRCIRNHHAHEATSQSIVE